MKASLPWCQLQPQPVGADPRYQARAAAGQAADYQITQTHHQTLCCSTCRTSKPRVRSSIPRSLLQHLAEAAAARPPSAVQLQQQLIWTLQIQTAYLPTWPCHSNSAAILKP